MPERNGSLRLPRIDPQGPGTSMRIRRSLVLMIVAVSMAAFPSDPWTEVYVGQLYRCKPARSIKIRSRSIFSVLGEIPIGLRCGVGGTRCTGVSARSRLESACFWPFCHGRAHLQHAARGPVLAPHL